MQPSCRKYSSSPVGAKVCDGRRVGVLATAIRKRIMCICCAYTQRRSFMRDASINLRALPEQRDLIDHAANLLGKNRSDFMLEAACERAKAIVLDQVFFSLDENRFREFTALLDAPQSANPGFERLMAVKAPWNTDSE